MTFEELATRMPEIEKASDTAPLWLAATVQDLVRDLGRPPLCVEVGTWCGWTALAMALAGARVVCVDTFDGRDAQTRERARELGGSTLDRFLANALWCGAAPNMISVVAESVRAAGLLPDGCADLVFIDADHERAAVQADLATWGPKVRAGGWLCGHDANQVGEAVLAYCPAAGFGPVLTTTLPDHLWAARRAA